MRLCKIWDNSINIVSKGESGEWEDGGESLLSSDQPYPQVGKIRTDFTTVIIYSFLFDLFIN